jgi:hypothetical protein
MQIQSLVPRFREILREPTLELCLAPEWGSTNKDSRLLLRQAITTELGDLSEIEKEILLRLDFVPKPPGASVSISHTQSIGGFAFTRAPAPAVGFDIEVTSRLSSKAVERVSGPGELQKAPGPSHVWVAKEAGFKSMRGSKQPAILSMLKTGAWSSVVKLENLSLWSCEIQEDSSPNAITRGLTVELSGIALSIFLHQPSLSLNLGPDESDRLSDRRIT